MKQIWHQNLLKSNGSGNAIVREKEGMIPGGLLLFQQKKKTALPIINFEISSDIDTVIYSAFHLNCMCYIAGNIARDIRC